MNAWLALFLFLPTLPVRWVADAECQGCHVEETRSWERSLHKASASNAAYERAVFAEPLPFCRKCHAPLADPNKETAGWARDNGITCTVCHLQGGAVVSSRASGRSPHPVTADPSFRTKSCGRCHEFDFPEAPGSKMQKTLTEHAAASHPDCATCHMPAGDHTFDVSRNRAFLSKSIHVVARREGVRVTFTITPRGVGHAFPTGDLFRRLVLVAGGQRRTFGRRIGVVAQGSGHVRREVADERVTGETIVSFELPERIDWHLDYERVAIAPNARPENAIIEGRERLAEGSL